MGHNLGMNHDGETSSGNSCDPNKNLMSPVLGPGKVTWSSCSNQEINDFLSNRFSDQYFSKDFTECCNIKTKKRPVKNRLAKKVGYFESFSNQRQKNP